MAVLVPVIEGIVQGLGELIQVLKTSPFECQGTHCFHQGSIRFSQQAYLGMNCNCISGQAARASLVYLLRWIDRLSSMINQFSAGKAVMIFSSSCTWLALSLPGLSTVMACPVAGSNAPCTHSFPRRP